MKKRIRSIVLGLLIAILSAQPIFASVGDYALESAESRVLAEDSSKVVVQLYDRRGNWIADGIIEISNPRNGKIGIYAETQCYMGVDEIIMSIAVDKQVGTNQWEQVDYLTYSFSKKNNQELTDASVDLQLSGHEANEVYRLRSVHSAILNGSSENLSGQTPGLTNTDH